MAQVMNESWLSDIDNAQKWPLGSFSRPGCPARLAGLVEGS